MLCQATDEWVSDENVYRLIDQVKCFELSIQPFWRKKIADTLKISQGTAGVAYSRHGLLDGLAICPLSSRRRRYARTSSAAYPSPFSNIASLA